MRLVGRAGDDGRESFRPDVILTSPGLFVLVLIGYAAGSKLALVLAEESGLGGVLFIPAGITVAALLRLPRSQWWLVLLAAGLAEATLDMLEGYSIGQVVGFVAANLAEPVVGALLVGLGCSRVDLARRRDVWWFIGGAVIAAPAVGAAIGATADRLAGGDPLASTFAQWWLGDAVAVVVVGGAILAWGSSPDPRSMASWRGAGLIGGSVLLTIGVFAFTDLPLMFLVLVGVVVGGAQFGTRAVTTTALVIGLTTAIVFAIDPDGLMAGVEEGTALVLVKLQLGLFTAAGMVVAAESAERARASQRATRLRARAAAEHRIVEQLQHLLLPPDRMSGEHFTATGIYRAASSDLGVGGDWYDATELPDGRLLVSVGDVVGHGVQAASVMEQLTVALSVLASEAHVAGELLERLDGYVERTAGAFCTTVWVGLWDPGTGMLSYASAGHPPGFVVARGDVVQLDDGRSAPLGVSVGPPRTSASVCIEGPATLVLYTDGLIERPSESLDVGLGRLEAALRRAVQDPRMDPADIVDRVAERRRRDDLVLLWVRLNPAPPARGQRSRDRRRRRRSVS